MDATISAGTGLRIATKTVIFPESFPNAPEVLLSL